MNLKSGLVLFLRIGGILYFLKYLEYIPESFGNSTFPEPDMVTTYWHEDPFTLTAILIAVGTGMIISLIFIFAAPFLARVLLPTDLATIDLSSQKEDAIVRLGLGAIGFYFLFMGSYDLLLAIWDILFWKSHNTISLPISIIGFILGGYLLVKSKILKSNNAGSANPLHASRSEDC